MGRSPRGTLPIDAMGMGTGWSFWGGWGNEGELVGIGGEEVCLEEGSGLGQGEGFPAWGRGRDYRERKGCWGS